MEDQIQAPDSNQPPPKGGFWKLQAVVFEPRNAFEEIRRHPTFVLPLLLGIAAMLLGTFLLFYLVGSETVTELALEMSPQSRGRDFSQEELAVITKMMPYQFYGISLFIPLIGVFAGSGVYLILLMLFGAQATYRQVVSVVAHSSFIYGVIVTALNAVVLMVMDDYRGLDIQRPATTGLGFLVDRADSPALYAAASAVDLPTFYYLFLAALGLSVITRSKSMSMGIAAVVIPYLLLVAFGVGMAYIFS